jgi:phosphatidylinositol glycan class V
VGVGILLFQPYFNGNKSPELFDSELNQEKNPLVRHLSFFIEWDAVHFYKVYKLGYTSISHFAFYPGLPYLLRFFDWVMDATILPKLFLETLGLWKVSFLLTGVCMNFTLHMVNNYLLYRLALLKRYSKEQAQFAALIFGIGGTTLFHVVLYSESLYLFVCLTSFCVIEQMYLKKVSFGSMPLLQFVLLIVFFGSAGWVRSLGLVNGAYVGYPLLLELFIALRSKQNRTKVIGIISRGLMTIICFAGPTVAFNYYNRQLFCYDRPPSSLAASYTQPPYCKSPVGMFYGYIQERYWGVRFLDWVKNPTHADTLVLVINSLIIAGFWIWNHLKQSNWKALLTLHIGEYLSHKDLNNKNIRLLPDLIIMLITCRIYYCYANLGSVERFWTVYPFWFMINIEFQAWANSKVKSTSVEDKSLRAMWFFLMKWLTLANIVIRYVPTLVFYACRIIPI